MKRHKKLKGFLLFLLGANLLLVLAFAAIDMGTRLLQLPGLAGSQELLLAWGGQGQPYFALAILVGFLYREWQWRWLPAFALVYGGTLLCEFFGVRFGLPFGEYGYSDLLGYRIAGAVPVVVPLSWFEMGIASFAVSSMLVPKNCAWARHLVTACILTCWDLALDPAMSHVTAYWWWGSPGAYYGVPLSNYLGWLLTGLFISFALQATLPGEVTIYQGRWLGCYYGANYLLPLGMIAAAGLWAGVFVAVGALVALYVLSRRIDWLSGIAVVGRLVPAHVPG